MTSWKTEQKTNKGGLGASELYPRGAGIKKETKNQKTKRGVGGRGENDGVAGTVGIDTRKK